MPSPHRRRRDAMPSSTIRTGRRHPHGPQPPAPPAAQPHHDTTDHPPYQRRHRYRAMPCRRRAITATITAIMRRETRARKNGG